MQDTQWWLQAACRRHPTPDWWFPVKGGTGATVSAAKRVCIRRCPVRRQCGEEANRTGEQFGIAAGFCCSVPSQRADLRLWLGLPPDPERPVAYCACGTAFRASRRYSMCSDCREGVDIEEVRPIIVQAHAEGMSYDEMAVVTGVSRTTLTGIVRGHHGRQQWHTVSRDRADRILALAAAGSA